MEQNSIMFSDGTEHGQKEKLTPVFPKGVRQLIYSFLLPLELYYVSKLSKSERALIPNNELINQARQMKQFEMRLKKGDFQKIKFIIDMSTGLPKFFRIWHARDFVDNLLVYQRAYQQNQLKVWKTKFVFDIYADFLSHFDMESFTAMTNLSNFTIKNVKFYKRESEINPLLYRFISLIICQMTSIKALSLESLRCHDVKTQRLIPYEQTSQTSITSVKLIDCDLMAVQDLFPILQNITELTLFDSGGFEFLSCINQFKNLRKFVLKKSSYMVSSAFDNYINFKNPQLQLDFCFQNSELHAADFFFKLSLCDFKQFDIEVKKFYLDQKMLVPYQEFKCGAKNNVCYTFVEKVDLENEPTRLSFRKYDANKPVSTIQILAKRLCLSGLSPNQALNRF